MNGKSDYWFIDNVQVTGTQTGPPELTISDVSVIEGDSGFTFNSAFVSAGSGGLVSPRGITFGPDGKLYVASTDTDSIRRYDGGREIHRRVHPFWQWRPGLPARHHFPRR